MASGRIAAIRWPELGHAVAHRRRDRDRLDTLLRARLAEGRPGLRRGRQVDLVEGDQHRLVEERRVVRPQLLADDVVVPLGVARRAVDDVDEDARPLDVAQEGVTEPGAAARALDEPGNVGDRRAPLVLVAEVHHPEVRLERRERVVGDLGRRRRSRRRGSSTCRRSAARPARCRRSDEARGGASPRRPARPSARASAPGGSSVLKCVLPSPPRPPRATIAVCPTATRSATSSPVSSS